jgi:hypothetical protein
MQKLTDFWQLFENPLQWSYLEFSSYVILPLMIIASIFGFYYFNYYISIHNIIAGLFILIKMPPNENIKKAILKELLLSPLRFIYVFCIILIIIFYLVLINESIIDAIVAMIFILAFIGILEKFSPVNLSYHFVKKTRAKLDKKLVRYQNQGEVDKAALLTEMIDAFPDLQSFRNA